MALTFFARNKPHRQRWGRTGDLQGFAQKNLERETG
jgi:hypothetical protein